MSNSMTGLSCPEPRDLDESIRRDLVDLLGETSVAKLLSRLANQTAELFADERLDAFDRKRLAADAHSMVSAAGMLGFSRFSALCSQLENACLDNQPIDGILADLKSARHRVTSELVSVAA